MDLGQQWHQAFSLVAPLGPVMVLPNVEVIAAFHAVIRRLNRRRVNLIAAINAVIKSNKRRIESSHDGALAGEAEAWSERKISA
jgi:hypothetical protein